MRKNIEENLRFTRGKINESTIRLASRDLREFYSSIQRIMKEKSFTTVEEATDYIEKEYYKIFFVNRGATLKNGKVSVLEDTKKSDYFHMKTTQYLKRHPEKILEVIDKMTSEERKYLVKEGQFFIRYTPDMESNYRTILKDISGYCLNLLKISPERFINGKMSYQERIDYQKIASAIVSKFSGDISNEIRSSYIRRITSMATLLDENGTFENGTIRYNSIMRKIGLEELQVEYEKSKKGNKPQFTTMRDLKNPKAIEKLSLDELIGISAFLTNRLGKEFSSYKRSKFILKEVGKLEDAKTDIYQPISDEELAEILGKYEYLKSVCRNLYTQVSEDVLQNMQEEDKGVTDNIFYKEIDLSDKEEEAPIYKEFYDRVLPNSENDFFTDIQTYNAENHIFEGIYDRKDFAFQTLITSLLDKKDENINWGYIPEEEYGRNSIEREKRMILIGVDFEGYNFPIKLHCSREDLLKIVKDYTGKDEIPVYKGDDDWKVNTLYGEEISMSGQSIVRLDKVKRKIIREKMKTMSKEDRNYNYLSHLNWMMNPNEIPDRFTTNEVVSLTTGELQEANKKGLEQK